MRFFSLGRYYWYRLIFMVVVILFCMAAPNQVIAQNQISEQVVNGLSDEFTVKGPVGWEIYRQLHRLPILQTGVRTRQFSSFDRMGGNTHDGFTGKFSCLRITDDGRCVIAQATGAGQIVSMWFTRNSGDISANGTITIELDGEVVLKAPLQKVVNGELGPPFVFPLVANADQSSGGTYIKVPMPYSESMLVTTENRPRFYILTYQAFADAEGVETFDPSEEAHDVLEMLRDAGQSDPKASLENAQTISKSFSAASGGQMVAGEEVILAELNGPGVINSLHLRIPQIVTPYSNEPIADDGRAFTGSSTFTVSIDPSNEGVRLTRRLNSGVSRQHARISVDGEVVAEWEPLPPSGGGQWHNQSVVLPASVTSGKSEITIHNEFISSEIDFNAYKYWVESKVNGEWMRTDVLDVGPRSLESERAHNYQIEDQNWKGMGRLRYPVERTPQEKAALHASDALLQQVHLRITFDGKQTVEAPIGLFFGSGLGERKVRSLFFAMDTSAAGWYSSWWPMPFARKATVTLVNASSIDIKTADFKLTWASGQKYAEGISSSGQMGYFHATTRRGLNSPGDDWLFLNVEGHGEFVGVVQAMEGRTGGRSYLEGDVRVYVDGSRTPQLHGTGTEDFYQGGWYFNRGTFTNFSNGNPLHEVQRLGCRFQCDVAYRLMIGPAVHFTKSVRFGIQHGPHDHMPSLYHSTAFWYGRTEPALVRTDVLDVGNNVSEKGHSYTAAQPGAIESLTSVFVGDFDEEKVTEDLRATNEEISFTLDINPEDAESAQAGVMLRRMTDQADGYQAARVYVDGQRVGTWRQPMSNKYQRWREDHFMLPPEVTAGKDHIRVRLVPLEGDPLWHAARYEAFVYVE